jgi:hypothetical protein
VDDPKRSELSLERQALKNGWDLSDAVKQRILKRIVQYLDRDHEEGQTAPDRTVLMAGRTLAQLLALGLKQQAIDLAREKLEGRKDEITLADLVAEAERRATERLNGRVGDANPDGGTEGLHG